jgi:hypothetical protein
MMEFFKWIKFALGPPQSRGYVKFHADPFNSSHATDIQIDSHMAKLLGISLQRFVANMPKTLHTDVVTI